MSAGLHDGDIASFFDVDHSTIGRWRRDYNEFRIAIEVGKQAADDAVERATLSATNGDARLRSEKDREKTSGSAGGHLP